MAFNDKIQTVEQSIKKCHCITMCIDKTVFRYRDRERDASRQV
jgi:hypothetical protein